jgi:hypothetical protein
MWNSTDTLSFFNFTNVTSPQCGDFGLPVCNYLPGLSVVLVFIALFIVSGNIFNIIILVRTEGLQYSAGYFLTNLAVADLLLGLTQFVFSIPLSIKGRWPTYLWENDMHGILVHISCSVSVWTLAGVNFDRYLAVIKPLTHQRIMTKKACACILTSTWIVNIIFNCIPLKIAEFSFHPIPYASFLNFPKYETFAIIYFFVYFMAAFGIISFCSVELLRIAKRHAKEMLKSSPGQREQQPRFSKATKTIMATTMGFVVCWTPFCCLQLYLLFSGATHDDPPIDTLDFIITNLARCHSFMNPIIYGVTHREYRRAVKKIIKKCSLVVCREESEAFVNKDRCVRYATGHDSSRAVSLDTLI